jgi:hypothetical protein
MTKPDNPKIIKSKNQNYPSSIQKWNDEKTELFEMLNNLKFIKFESNIQELDEVLNNE